MLSLKENDRMLEIQPPSYEETLFEKNDEICETEGKNKLKFLIPISRALWPQILLTLAILINAISCGMAIAHSSVLIPQLKSSNSSLDTDDDTASWIASIYNIVAPLGCFFGGVWVDVLGRKRTYTLSNIGLVTGWVIVTFAQNNMMLILSRIIEGFSRSVAIISKSILIDEIADPKLRGSITSLCFVGYSIGMFAISGLGSIADWRIASAIAGVIAVVGLVLNLMLPETAPWLVTKHRIHEAHHTLIWIWGPNHELQAQQELKALVEKQQPGGRTAEPNKSRLFNFILDAKKIFRLIFTPPVLKPFIIMHIINTLQAITGHLFFLLYSVDILSRSNAVFNTSSPDVYLANVIVSVIRVVVTIISTICLLHMGRRTIALISGVGTSASALAIAIILYVQVSSSTTPAETKSLISFLLIILFIASHTFGFYSLPGLMMGETQQTVVRGFATGYIFTVTDFVTGAVTKSYFSMLEVLGIPGLFFLFGISCVVCTVFIYLFLPETQGKTLTEIEDYFKQSNILWINRNKRLNKRLHTIINFFQKKDVPYRNEESRLQQK